MKKYILLNSAKSIKMTEIIWAKPDKKDLFTDAALLLQPAANIYNQAITHKNGIW